MKSVLDHGARAHETAMWHDIIYIIRKDSRRTVRDKPIYIEINITSETSVRDIRFWYRFHVSYIRTLL